MPIFEYKCPKCEARLEIIVRGAEFVPECEKCSAPMEKQFSQTAPPIFKGHQTHKSRKPRT